MQRFAWIAFLCLDVGLIVLFLAGYAARYVHPRHLWWLQLIAITLPYLSMALLIPAVGAIVLGKWKMLAVHLVLGVLMIIRFAPFERLSAGAEGQGESLTVMTYNAKFKSGIAATREGRIHDVLGDAPRPDLIALQETYVKFVGDRTQLYYPPDTTWFIEAYGYATRRPEELLGGRLYQPILSRDSLEEMNLLWLYNDAGRASAESATRARFRWQGREVALYNVHLRSFNLKPWDETLRVLDPGSWQAAWRAYRRDVRIRAYHTEQVRRMLADEPLPFIVCGDFNSTPHNWSYRHLTDGLQDAFKAAGRGWGGTYHALYPFFRIDYVLVSSAFEVRAAHRVAPVFSDHLPLVAAIAWQVE